MKTVKNILVFISALILVTNSIEAYAEKPSVIRIFREGGGLLGYYEISQNVFQNDQGLWQADISCMRPGNRKCNKFRFLNIPSDVLKDFEELTELDFDYIDGMVYSSITESNTSGKFIYNGVCLVMWNYNVDTGGVEYFIYNRMAANNIGFYF